MVRIREIEEKDIPAVLRLIKDSYAPYKDLISGAGIPEYSYEDVSSLAAESHSDVWVAEENGEITGMAAGTELAVSESFSSEGNRLPLHVSISSFPVTFVTQVPT